MYIPSITNITAAVADLGGLGGCSPPPSISGHTKGWMCCYKNTLKVTHWFLQIVLFLYISIHNNLYVPSKELHPPYPLVLFWLAPSCKTLRVELNTLNLALGGISVLHKTKYSIASGGLCPQIPCFRDPLLCLVSPLRKSYRSAPE